jgi:hypothetical protein
MIQTTGECTTCALLLKYELSTVFVTFYITFKSFSRRSYPERLTKSLCHWKGLILMLGISVHKLLYPVQRHLNIAHSPSEWHTYPIHVSRLKHPYLICLQKGIIAFIWIHLVYAMDKRLAFQNGRSHGLDQLFNMLGDTEGSGDYSFWTQLLYGLYWRLLGSGCPEACVQLALDHDSLLHYITHKSHWTVPFSVGGKYVKSHDALSEHYHASLAVQFWKHKDLVFHIGKKL